MMSFYLQMVTVWERARREELGMTTLEYGVFAGFIVLAISAVAFTVGPEMAKWLQTSICEIMGGGVGKNGC